MAETLSTAQYDGKFQDTGMKMKVHQVTSEEVEKVIDKELLETHRNWMKEKIDAGQ